MPIENEWKFVILEESTLVLGHIPVQSFIKQGYLGDGARLRSTYKPDGSHRCQFTWKRDLISGEVMEIETDITLEDFNFLWTECSSSLTKFRSRLSSDFPGVWDMDYFWKDEETKMMMVEVEDIAERPWNPTMPVHPLIENFKVYPVKQGMIEFSSRSLSQPNGIAKALGIINQTLV